MKNDRYELKVLQNGKLPVQLDGRLLPFTEHVCTSVVVWPEGTMPDPNNSLIVDPCFSERGARKAAKRLQRLGGALDRIGHVFVTHGHRDHLPNIPGERSMPQWDHLSCARNAPLQGIRCCPCPGHSQDLVALVLNTKAGECWIVGDAIIDKTWLMHWGYYWPNGYTAEQISETWRTVAGILTKADVVVPGHGAAFEVTTSIVEKALAEWPKAAHCSMCPDVAVSLRSRLGTLRTTNNPVDANDE